jgi:hypothetical protein
MSPLLKPFARPALAGFVLVAGLAAISGTASALPAGSYLQSCQNISQTGDILKANCRTKAGSLNPASYQISKCRKAGDNLSNIDGRLRCVEALPGGTYRNSCSTSRGGALLGYNQPGIVYDGILYSYCKSISGQWVETKITVSSCTGGVIANINGRLVCTR